MTAPAPTILEAMAHPAIWRPWFRNATSWAPWRAFLAALFGLPLTGADLALYRTCTGRSAPPAGGTNEAWLVVGRRGGKSIILALIACYLAVFRDWRRHLSPGEIGTIKVIATDRRQARVIHRYCRALLTNVPTFADLVERDGDDEIMLSNSISIEVQTASFRSVRGYTVVAALCDEIAFWRSDETAANPDSEILAAIRPAMATIPEPMLLCASSPYARRGELYRAYRSHYGRDDAPALVWKADTRTMNPSVPLSVIEEATERDPASAAAEYGAKFRTDIETFVSRDVVEALIVPHLHELTPVPGVAYTVAVDVSGGSSDSMVTAGAHAEPDGTVVLDFIREARPPFSPEAATAEHAETVRAYGCTRIVGDRYGGLWPVEAFARCGIAYEAADRVKSDFYRDLLPLLNSGKVRLLDNARLINQLCSLERRVGRGTGRDIIDHPPGAHDDIANAAAIALVLAALVAETALWRNADLLTDNRPAIWPHLASAVFASLAADASGVAILYWAADTAFGGPALTLIDYDRQSFGPDLFNSIRDRLRAEAAAAHAGAALLTTAALAAQAQAAFGAEVTALLMSGDLAHARAADLCVEGIADALLADREALLLAAATAVGAGRVKLAAAALDRALHLPLPLADLRPGAPPSAATDAALVGIGAAIDLRSLPKAA